MELETKDSNALACPVDTLVTLSVPDAFEVLKKAMQDDPDYAWSWHCNIAMMCHDAILAHDDQVYFAHKVGNDSASRFMRLCFDIDTAKHKNFTAM
jgi:hypothetical protein